MPTLSPRKRSAFTLLELVVVVAILTILLALTLAGIGRMRSRAASVNCLNQMRQIGVNVHIYLGEHRYRFFEQGAAGGLGNWIKQIDPNASPERNIYKCPADKTPSRIERTYRVNRTIGASGPANTAAIYDKYYHQVLSPASTILLFCVAYNGPASMPLFKSDTDSWTITLDRTSDYFTAYPRLHDPGAVNLLFVDGHVATMRYPIEDRFYYWDRP